MSASTNTEPMLSADGKPLKQSLARALRRQKIRALLLIAPLLAFIFIAFLSPDFKCNFHIKLFSDQSKSD